MRRRRLLGASVGPRRRPGATRVLPDGNRRTDDDPGPTMTPLDLQSEHRRPVPIPLSESGSEAPSRMLEVRVAVIPALRHG